MCVIVSTSLIFMFVDQLFVDMFSQLYYITYAKKQPQRRDLRYKSLKSWKIDNIDFTQQFSLSIFTDFRYQSIKITWLLPTFIDTDFYRLTTPGYTAFRNLLTDKTDYLPKTEAVVTFQLSFKIVVFLYCRHKVKYSCCRDPTVIRSWFVYLVKRGLRHGIKVEHGFYS